MAYTAVRGGQAAIAAAEALIAVSARERVAPARALAGLPALVDQVMGEGGLYAPELAALAITQAEGDPIEAAFLLRAFRSTLPRIGYSLPGAGEEVRVRRRISSAFKEVPGGQVLGRTRDYTQRLLDLDGRFAERALAAVPPEVDEAVGVSGEQPSAFPKVIDALRTEGLVPPVPTRPAGEPEPEPFDVTRDAPVFPAPRSARLQALARGETGFVVAMAYSVMRGFGAGHPTIAELRAGALPVRIAHPLTGSAVSIGTIDLTEVEAISHASSGVGAGAAANLGAEADRAARAAPRFDFGYGAVFGGNERKAIAMAILDTALSIPGNTGPAADEEFVLQHCDPLDSSGFVEHLKLPHYVTFQSQLDRLRHGRLAALAGTQAKAAVRS
jgi:alpha-D-ribose 1-methylphosphonate 5-triphosphate synthase subunit PhnI